MTTEFWSMHTQLFSRVWLFATLWTVAIRLLCPWNIPGKNTGVGCHFLLQEIFPTGKWEDSLPLSHLGSPVEFWRKTKLFSTAFKAHHYSFLYRLQALSFLEAPYSPMPWYLDMCYPPFSILPVSPYSWFKTQASSPGSHLWFFLPQT